jgi:protease IV
VRDLFDRGPFLGEEALEAKLVDRRAYLDELQAELVERSGGESRAPLLDRATYGRRRTREVQRQVLRRARGTFAVLNVSGTIKSGDSMPGPEGASATGSDAVASALKELRERDDVRAVIIRISSPGGSGVASDLMWREVARTREKKPVVVSCGDVAASGGYYVAVGGSPIFAEAGTITGSIGVIAGKANLRGLYDRIGVNKEIVSRGKHAHIHSDYVPLGEPERARIRAEAESLYRLFVDRVASSRRLSTEAVDAVAEGRVWTGRQAWTRGLVDQLGGLDDAFEAAKTLVGVPADEPVQIERHPRPRRMWKLSLDLALPTRMLQLPELLGVPLPLRVLLRDRVWALWPFDIRFF